MHLSLEQDASNKTCMFLCVENCEMWSFFLKKEKRNFKKCGHFGRKNVTENVQKHIHVAWNLDKMTRFFAFFNKNDHIFIFSQPKLSYFHTFPTKIFISYSHFPTNMTIFFHNSQHYVFILKLCCIYVIFGFVQWVGYDIPFMFICLLVPCCTGTIPPILSTGISYPMSC